VRKGELTTASGGPCKLVISALGTNLASQSFCAATEQIVKGSHDLLKSALGLFPPTSTNPIEQPIDLFLNGPAYTTFLHIGITAKPVAPLASSLFNRPQGDNYARKCPNKATGPVYT
jgi:hypothetical protein